MQFTYTGTNPAFLDQSFFDGTGTLSVALTSSTPTEFVLTHTVYAEANVFVTFRGFGFAADAQGVFTSGIITSIEFNGLDIRQATVSDIGWSAVAFQQALFDIANAADFTGIADLFNESGPITIDASSGLSGFDQELAWEPFLPLLTQPITFIGSRFDDAVEGTSRADTINTGTNTEDGDRIVASLGNDTFIFNPTTGTDAPGFILDYDRINAPVTFDIDGVLNTGSATGAGFTDTYQDVTNALSAYLGLEGTSGNDSYTVRLAPGQVVSLIGGPGSDSYDIDAEGAVPILDFLFTDASAGLDLNFATGVVANDGFGGIESLDITGTPLRTILLATDTDDVVTDGMGNQLVRGFDGDDTFFASNLGNDSVSGGNGTDTVVFAEIDEGQSTITFSGAISTLTDRDTPDGSTAMLGVEIIETSGGVQFALDRHDGIGQISAADLTTLTELYIAYFNRAADALGLSFWATAFQKNGFSLREIAELFFDQPETQSLYDGMSNTAFVNAVYGNVFGRNADDDGRTFWTSQLDAGNVTQAGFIVDFLAGARAETGSPEDVAFIETKTDIGLYFAVIQGQSDVADARDVMDAFDGSISSLFNAIGLADDALAAAELGSTDLLLPVVGVIDDPFSAAV
ncbi:DUF4214 domain-containing protein [Marivita sp. S6314]|uniref:DUF4214 domain-containing protein n=1 Tax=Marivita sp. S6314 TaxID=2926406 RepID=UPI001FF10F0E|nr:DUF4214 domain-containing protein [Marivita sp. S6314]MCK0149997.1 DUF4214 domain-containing protein [Marivita sp. S6314]